jgi:chorismate lyase/3-hydroxybenzoate synthase
MYSFTTKVFSEDAWPVVPAEPVYCTQAQYDAMLQADKGRSLLAEIRFGDAPPAGNRTAHPIAHVTLAQLGAQPLMEIWRSPLPVSQHRAGRLVYSRNGEILFGCLANDQVESERFEPSVYQSYLRVLGLVQTQGYPHLLRIWNHFPGIAGETKGLDRYRLFCRARARAFEKWFGGSTHRLPSASAVGAHTGPLVIYFLAARQPGVPRENARQTSAYHYPPQYGPKSPSFARATLKDWGAEKCLYISGTASIVGHRSRHPGDPQAQLDEILRNLDVLIESTGAQESTGFRGLGNITHLKTYIRHPAHLPGVRARLDQVFGSDVQRIHLQADICRPDLLLEIEAVARARNPDHDGGPASPVSA